MMVLVDTPIWSIALRRDPARLNTDQEKLRTELADLIREGRARLIGPIRQELLSGIRESSQFRKLRTQLREFDDATLDFEDYEHAAELSNRCRASGIATTAADMLICAVAMRRRWGIFTADQDYEHYRRQIPLTLHQVM